MIAVATAGSNYFSSRIGAQPSTMDDVIADIPVPLLDIEEMLIAQKGMKEVRVAFLSVCFLRFYFQSDNLGSLSRYGQDWQGRLSVLCGWTLPIGCYLSPQTYCRR